VAGTGKPANNADVTDYAAAAATAQQKADDAQTAAESYTNIREQAMIDGVITDAEQGAIDAAAIDAANKANAAESAAESAAQLYTEGWSGQNADVTGDNTAANTNAVAGTAATTVRDNAADGNSAKGTTDYWKRPEDVTTIDGNKIFTGDAYVDTLQIKGQAVTFPRGVSASNNISAVGNVLSIAITATGAPLIITGSVNITDANKTVYGDGGRVEASLYRGGTKIFGPVSVATAVSEPMPPGGPIYGVVGGGSIQAYMSSGVSGTYYLKLSLRGVGTDPRVESRSLTIVEAKR